MALSSEQKRNAGIIISVGRSLGASDRDILTALMAAMQESSLRNLSHGDRDSIGLFQQRTRGWADSRLRMDPVHATRMFFTGGYGGAPGLFDKKNRNQMSMSQAAQAVQVSAYPNAYARHENIARSLLGGGGAPVAAAASGSSWTRPVRSGEMTQEFGKPNARYASGHHTGQDYGVPTGTPVYSAAAGKVVRVASGGPYGTRVEIEHGGKVWTLYAHLSRATVSVGDTVSAGQQIALSGNSGLNTSGPHLHFEVRSGANKYANTVDPSSYLSGGTTPVAYVEGGQSTTRVVDTITQADLAQYMGGDIDKAVSNALPKPYVYISPLDMMGPSAIDVGGSDPLAAYGVSDPLPQFSPLPKEEAPDALDDLRAETMV